MVFKRLRLPQLWSFAHPTLHILHSLIQHLTSFPRKTCPPMGRSIQKVKQSSDKQSYFYLEEDKRTMTNTFWVPCVFNPHPLPFIALLTPVCSPAALRRNWRSLCACVRELCAETEERACLLICCRCGARGIPIGRRQLREDKGCHFPWGLGRQGWTQAASGCEESRRNCLNWITDLKSGEKVPQKQAAKEGHFRNDGLSIGPIVELDNKLSEGI